jgi:hypothetical protein
MPMTSFEDFRDYCEFQDVGLSPVLSELTQKQMDPLNPVYCPTTIAGAVASAGSLLREPTIKPIAERPIKIDRRVLRNGSAALALAKMVNGSLKPDYDYGEVAFDCTTDRRIDACQSAEYRFARTVLEIEEGSNPNCHIVGNGKPVLLRKASPYGTPSTLTLTDITINGVPYPRGSIVRLDLLSDVPYIKGAQKGIESIGLDDVKNVGFVRLSAFAMFGIERISFREAVTDSAGKKPIRNILIEELVKAAESVYMPAH